jgi:outer membrane protein assembly factor BamB
MMSFPRWVAPLGALVLLSGCALWPFKGGPSKAPEDTQEGRISLLALDQKLKADPGLRGALQLPAPHAQAEWPQPGGTPDNAPGSIEGSAEPSVAWRANVGEGDITRTRLTAPPVIADGKLFVVAGQQTVKALDAKAGRTLWSTRLRSGNPRDKIAQGGGVAYADGRVFATSGFGFIVALDAQTGAEIWRVPTAAPFSAAPTVANGRVFATTNDSELLAIDAATGSVLWNDQAIAEPARVLAAPSPAVTPDAVIAPFASGELVAFAPANGRRLWSDALSRSGRLTALSSINDVAGRPAVIGGAVYAASHSGLFAAIDQRSGERIWENTVASTQTPYVVGDAVFALSSDAELMAFDRINGKVYWITPLKRFENPSSGKGRIAWTGPILFGGRLVAASSTGTLVFVDPIEGAIERTEKLKDAVFVPPVAADGMLYILTNSGRLIALQ